MLIGAAVVVVYFCDDPGDDLHADLHISTGSTKKGNIDASQRKYSLRCLCFLSTNGEAIEKRNREKTFKENSFRNYRQNGTLKKIVSEKIKNKLDGGKYSHNPNKY